MKIAIASDLHLDFADLPEAFYGNPEGADVLLLAGDIAESRRIHEFHHVFDRLTQEYSKVFMISGNHEFYVNEHSRSLEQMQEIADKFDNLWFMNDDYQILDDNIVLIGSTLWTDYNNGNPLTKHIAISRMNDFNNIRKGNRRMIPDDCYEWHNQSKHYIRTVASEHRDKHIIVMTHHAPSFKSIHPSYVGRVHENGLFVSDLSDLILDEVNIKLWVHGHTHSQWSYEIGQCRIECNPRGYPNELGSQYYELYRPKMIDMKFLQHHD
jgi:predicted phosphohydrolase